MENLHEGFDRVLDDIQSHLRNGDLIGARQKYRLALASTIESQIITANNLSVLRDQVQAMLTSLGNDATIIELVTSSD